VLCPLPTDLIIFAAMDLILPKIQFYAESLTTKENDLLYEVHQFTLQHHSEYQMLSGHLQGKFLEMVSCMIRPHRILEIGTFTGYSGLCLAKGLQQDGELHTIELREKDASTARNYFSKSEYASKIILHQGNAREIISVLHEEWDLVFIDADKPGYIEYFNLVFPQVKKNGFILADNIFFHGQVIEEPVTGKNAKAIIAFNVFISARTDIEKVALTLRDGLYLIKKL
jgi:predicted O-methyltransferase YrrM